MRSSGPAVPAPNEKSLAALSDEAEITELEENEALAGLSDEDIVASFSGVDETHVDGVARYSVLVPDSEDRVTIEHHVDGTIVVHRPSAWTGYNLRSPESYVWEGGVPDPSNVKVPALGRYTKEDELCYLPIVAALRAQDPDRKVTPKARARARLAWVEAWTGIAPHMEPEAARFCALYGLDAVTYQALSNRRDLLDYITTAPGVGPFLTGEAVAGVPENSGLSLQEFAEMVLGRALRRNVKLEPGMLLLLRRMPMEPELFAGTPKSGEAFANTAKRVVINALGLGARIDANGVHKIETDAEWTLIYGALDEQGLRGLVPFILKDPVASAGQVEKYFPEDWPASLKERTTHVLASVAGWRAANREEAGRVEAFGGMVKRARKWDQSMFRADTDEVNRVEAIVQQAVAERDRVAAERLARQQRLLEDARRRGGGGFIWTLDPRIDPDAVFPVQPPVQRHQSGGFVMVFHATPGALQDESVLMRNCVVTHARQCLAGSEYIFSLRTAAEPDMPLATVSVSARDWRITEQRGPGNATLGAEMRDQIRSMLNTIRRLAPPAERRALNP